MLYFGHTVVPISDFSTFFQVGKEILNLQLPTSFKYRAGCGYPAKPACVCVVGVTAAGVDGGVAVKRNFASLHGGFAVACRQKNYWQVRRLVCRNRFDKPLDGLLPDRADRRTRLHLFFVLLTLYLIFRLCRWAYLAASVTTMVRYEGAGADSSAFVGDIIHRKDRRDVIWAVA